MGGGLEIPRSYIIPSSCAHGILCHLLQAGTAANTNNSHDALYILDPATRRETLVLCPEGLFVRGYGFYFEPRTCSFSILAAMSVSYDPITEFQYMIFDSSSSHWRRLNNIPVHSLSLERDIHWIAHSIGQYCYFKSEDEGNLIEFDMEKEELTIFPIPCIFPAEKGYSKDSGLGGPPCSLHGGPAHEFAVVGSKGRRWKGVEATAIP
ncbi:hypothetical protein AMTRI_Chr04g244060 [Amborella trichopoda]